MPRGLIQFLLFNKYLGIGSVLEKQAASRSPDTSLHTPWPHSSIPPLPPICRTLRLTLSRRTRSSSGGANKASPLKGMPDVSPAVHFFRLTGIKTAGDNWQNPLRAVAYYIIFFVHEKRHPLQEINSGSSVSPMR